MAKIKDNITTEHYPCAEKKSSNLFKMYSAKNYVLVIKHLYRQLF